MAPKRDLDTLTTGKSPSQIKTKSLNESAKLDKSFAEEEKQALLSPLTMSVVCIFLVNLNLDLGITVNN